RHADVVDQVQGAERLRQLEAARQPQPGALMRDQPVERPAVEGDAAGLVLQRAAQAIDEGALARAVWPDQPDPLAGGDRQVDAVERDKAAEPLAEPADGKERRRTHAALCGSRCGAP